MEENDVKESLMASSLALTVFWVWGCHCSARSLGSFSARVCSSVAIWHTVLSSCLPRAGRSSTWRGGWGWPARRGRGRGPWWGCAHCGCWGRVDACIFTASPPSGGLAGPQRSGWHLAWPLCKPRKISGATWRANIHHDAGVSLVCKTIAVSVTLDTDLIRLAACRILHIGHNSLPVLQCCSAVLQCTTLHYAQYWNCCWLLQHPILGDKVNTFWITLFYLETGY